REVRNRRSASRPESEGVPALRPEQAGSAGRRPRWRLSAAAARYRERTVEEAHLEGASPRAGTVGGMRVSAKFGKRMAGLAASVMMTLVFGGALTAVSSAAAGKLTQVRMSIDEDPIVLRLADSLGYLKQEGIEIVTVALDKMETYIYSRRER